MGLIIVGGHQPVHWGSHWNAKAAEGRVLLLSWMSVSSCPQTLAALVLSPWIWSEWQSWLSQLFSSQMAGCGASQLPFSWEPIPIINLSLYVCLSVYLSIISLSLSLSVSFYVSTIYLTVCLSILLVYQSVSLESPNMACTTYIKLLTLQASPSWCPLAFSHSSFPGK